MLGLGHWYSAFGLARALPEYPRATLVAAAWHNPAQLAAFASAFGVDAYADYQAVLSRDDVDIVHIAAPVAEIPDLAIRAARAGKHIILGKPMAMTVAQADQMVAEVHAAGVTCVAFQGLMRLRAGALKARIDAGSLARSRCCIRPSRWSIAEDWYQSGTPGWFVDRAQVPGGAFIDEGIYWIDLFRWLAGSEIVTVEAKTANLVHKDIAVEDWGMATFTFANGVHRDARGRLDHQRPATIGPSPKQNSVVRLEMVGTRGEFIDQWFRDPGRAVLSAGAENWVFERQAEPPFSPRDAVPPRSPDRLPRDGTPSPANIDEARKSFIVAMAAYQSAREGRPVHLSW